MPIAPLTVHRCRFLDWTPSPITAIAFPPALPPSLSKNTAVKHVNPNQFGMLAVGRANGNIEICEWAGTASESTCRQAWVIRKILPAPIGTKVDALTFVLRNPKTINRRKAPRIEALRLFSTGGSSDILEWDIERNTVLRAIPSQGGSIWSLAANPTSTLLAIGCEDGSLRLISLQDGEFSHLRRFQPIKTKMLSIAWGPPLLVRPQARASDDGLDSDGEEEEEGEGEWVDSWLVTGCSDSTIRKWDFRTGRVLERMTADHTRKERTLVWAVAVISDGTVISGDSLGTVRFWDAQTSTQLQSFHAHGADVLCIAVGTDGQSVYTSGVDQKIAEFSSVQINAAPDNHIFSSSNTDRWTQTTARRLHSHDVRTLAIYPPHSPFPSSQNPQIKDAGPRTGISPVIVSGGLDMSPILLPCAPRGLLSSKLLNPLGTGLSVTFAEAYHRRISYSVNTIQVARGARMVLCRKDEGISVWRIRRLPGGRKKSVVVDGKGGEGTGKPWDMILDMKFNLVTHLQSSAISPDGGWVAISDAREVKLFRLISEGTGTTKSTQIHPKRIKSLQPLLLRHLPNNQNPISALALAFAPDSSKLALAIPGSAEIVVLDLTLGGDDLHILRIFKHHGMRDIIVGGEGRVIKSLPGREEAGRGDDGLASSNIEQDQDQDGNQSGDEDETMQDPPTSPSPSPVTETETNTTTAGSSITATVNHLVPSPDGQWLASADMHGRVHIFNLDSMQHHTTLPSFSNHIASMSFDPSTPHHLLLAFTNNAFQIFDVEAHRFPAWAESLSKNISSRLTGQMDSVLGVVFDPRGRKEEGGEERSVLLWGSTWICKIYFDPTSTPNHPHRPSKNHKKRRQIGTQTRNQNGDEDESTSSNFRIVTKYRQVIAVDFLGGGELVVVERPLGDLLHMLPPAYFKAKYGS